MPRLFSWLILLILFSPAQVFANCRGCCSHHGGVVCRDGATQCRDGTPSSAKCRAKECNKCGFAPLEPISSSIPATTSQSVSTTDRIKIANFNIQVFGKTKANKSDVMGILANILIKFDIIAIQEIRDKSGTAIKKLEAAVDALGERR